MNEQIKLERIISGVVLLTLLVGCLSVLRPFVSALLWAVILSFSSWPLYQRLVKLLRGRRTLAALLMALGMILIMPVGPPLVWIPAAVWLFHQGSTGWGIFMLVWGIGVSSVDNVVKPWLISQGSDMPFLLILFGVLGGALTFGFIGVFIGPTLLAIGYRLVVDWAPANTEVARQS